MKTETLAVRLKMLVDEYAEKNNLEKGKPFEKQGVLYYAVDFERIKLEFAYNKKNKANYPISTLSCRVYLDKNSTFFFEMPEVIDYIDALDYHCYYFPYIESEERMTACFNYITEAIEYRIDEINSISLLSYKYKKIKLEEIKEVFDIETSEFKLFNEESEKKAEEIDNYVSAFIIGRFTKGKAYLAYLNNDYETALSEYKKMDKLTSYEKKLVKFIEGRFAPYQAVDEDCASILEVQKYTSKEEVKYFGIALAASIAGFYLLLVIIQLLVNLHFHRTAVFTDAINPFISALWGILPGIFIVIAFRYKIEALFRKDKKQANDFYELLNAAQDNQKTKIIAFGVALFIALIMFSDYCQPTYILYENGMKYNTHARPFNHYAAYPAKDFVDVVIVEDRPFYKNYNKKQKKNKDVQEQLEDLQKQEEKNRHYAIQLKHGQYIDFDTLHTSRKQKEKLVKLLRGERTHNMRRVNGLDDLEV